MDQKILIGGDLYGSEDFDWWGSPLWIRRFWLVSVFFMDQTVLIGFGLLYGSGCFDWFESSWHIIRRIWYWSGFSSRIIRFLLGLCRFCVDQNILIDLGFLYGSEDFDWFEVFFMYFRIFPFMDQKLLIGVLYVHQMILISLGFLYWSEGFDWSASSYGSKESDWFGFSLWVRRLIDPGH